MACYPHTKLFHHPHRIVLISGPHIQVLNAHGHILHSTVNFAREDRCAVIQSGPVRCSAVDHDARYLATVGDDKQLKIWDLDSLTLSSTRTLPKKPTSIVFSKSTDILVSDKFGDVFRYTLHPNDAPVQEKRGSDPLASHENPSNGDLILGHASLLTSCMLTPDEKFIITADRDEHIRVSWYPEGYVVESYCLGHRKYVSAIHVPQTSPMDLISGGGDPELKVWDWMTGRLQRNISVLGTVKPFIRVRPKSRRHASSGEHNDDEEAVSSRSGKKHGRKAKRRTDVSLELEDVEMHLPSEGTNDTSNVSTPTFVVRRIDSFLSGGEHHVIFSVVGATAIFYFILTDTDTQPHIQHRDFGQPVIDFTVSENGTVWVLLDADFSEVQGSDDVTYPQSRKLVQAIQWSIDRFVDADLFPELLDSFHSACVLPATAPDLEALDLYADLLSLPKSVHEELDTGSGHDHVPRTQRQPSESTEVIAGLVLTKRALGRLKHKRALDQLHLGEMATTTEGESGGSEAKKIKADLDDDGDEDDDDDDA